MVSSASAQIEASASFFVVFSTRVYDTNTSLAAGDRLKTILIVKGKRVVVPDYATVRQHLAFKRCDAHCILFPDFGSGPRHLDRCRLSLCTNCHHNRTRVRYFCSS